MGISAGGLAGIGAGLGLGGAIGSGFLGSTGGAGNALEFQTPGFFAKIKATGGETVGRIQRRPGSTARLFARAIPRLAGDVSDLRGELAVPGFGVRSRAVQRSREAAIGNLRENLARRRLAGSSFAEDALARVQAEFAAASGEAAFAEIQDNLTLISEEARLLGLGLQQELAELGAISGSTQNFAALQQESLTAGAAALGAVGELGGLLTGFGLANLPFSGGGGETPVSAATLPRFIG